MFEVFYPSETHASYGSAQYVRNNRWVRLACGKVRMKSWTVPMSYLIEKFFIYWEKNYVKRRGIFLPLA